MSVLQFTATNFRNLDSEKVDFHTDLNFIVGDNGSGKSSLLEALFYLGHGKSFRTSHVDSLIAHSFDKFVISIKTHDDRQLGVSRSVNGETQIKVNGERYIRLSELAKNIAIQVITPESFKLFFGGPKERRKFVDLGMFHVKHSFSSLWKDFNRVLKQRNACLKTRIRNQHSIYWTEQFCSISENIAGLRKKYITELKDELEYWLNILLPNVADKIDINYLQGWNSKKELHEVLAANVEREYERGFSLYGAQKFDIRFVINNIAIEHQLSRGQQKLFLLALTFAQAKLIEKVKRVKPIILIDDIGAELDIHSRIALASAYQYLNCQTIITAIDKVAVEPLVPSDNNYNMFHVKHGRISAIGK